MKIKKKLFYFFLIIAHCKFGHRKFELQTWSGKWIMSRLSCENLKKVFFFFLVIALCKFLALKTSNQDISKTITVSSFKLGQLLEDTE